MWPPVSRFAAFQPTKQGVHCLKVCNALERVLGAFSVRSGFSPILHQAACFGILRRRRVILVISSLDGGKVGPLAPLWSNHKDIVMSTIKLPHSCPQQCGTVATTAQELLTLFGLRTQNGTATKQSQCKKCRSSSGDKN